MVANIFKCGSHKQHCDPYSLILMITLPMSVAFTAGNMLSTYLSCKRLAISFINNIGSYGLVVGFLLRVRARMQEAPRSNRGKTLMLNIFLLVVLFPNFPFGHLQSSLNSFVIWSSISCKRYLSHAHGNFLALFVTCIASKVLDSHELDSHHSIFLTVFPCLKPSPPTVLSTWTFYFFFHQSASGLMV